MTQEEKATRYDEAIKRAKAWCDCEHATTDDKILLKRIFPELKESEDERIRKALMQNLKERFGTKGNMGEGLDMPDVLAWIEKQGKNNMGISEATKRKLEDNLNKALEKETPESWNEFLDKQGEEKKSYDTCDSSIINGKKSPYSEKRDFGYFEKKPTDKVEPKFIVGDWVVYEENIYQIHNISLKKYYECLRTDGTVHTFDFEYIDSKSHLWTIQDAKDGDVLSYVTDEGDLWIMIYWSLYEPYDGHVHYHALLVNDNFTDKGTCCICIDNLKPATKEQRELLFLKMKEAGYEWDAEKKELKKIEQKPAWSEEDDKKAERIIRLLQEAYDINCINGSIDWLKFLKDRVQPKQEWSDVDKDILFRTIDNLKFLRDTISIDPKYAVNIIDIEREIDLLKNLKDRVRPKH